MKNCDNCALHNIQNGVCPVFRSDMTGKGGCPYHTTELRTCGICGGLILGRGILEPDDTGAYQEICPQCSSAEPCQTCIRKQQCAFTQDTTCPEPPMVMIQKRQGNMVIQTQQMNPKRVEATCRKGCPCFWEEGLDDGIFCLKQIGCGCTEYKINWRK